MLFAAVYLALLGVCIAFTLARRHLVTRWAATMRPPAREPRHDRGLTWAGPPAAPRAYAAQARLLDHRQWSWGGAVQEAAYGAPALTAVFVLLDLSRLAVEAPAAPPLSAPELAPQAFDVLDSAWLSATASLDLSAAAPLDDQGLAWSDIGLPLQPVHTDAGWFV
jgi:hypothetical protein